MAVAMAVNNLCVQCALPVTDTVLCAVCTKAEELTAAIQSLTIAFDEFEAVGGNGEAFLEYFAEHFLDGVPHLVKVEWVNEV